MFKFPIIINYIQKQKEYRYPEHDNLFLPSIWSIIGNIVYVIYMIAKDNSRYSMTYHGTIISIIQTIILYNNIITLIMIIMTVIIIQRYENTTLDIIYENYSMYGLFNKYIEVVRFRNIV
jgi:hypothetical protein